MSCIQNPVVRALFLASLFGLQNLRAQSGERMFSVLFQPVFSNQKIVLDAPFFDKKGNSAVIQTLKFYVGNFEFWKNGRVVFSEKSHRLLDLENAESLVLAFQIPEKMDFDSLYFELGVDSLTQVSGATGGDLDPTRGMFWTWQSGYIHFKIEGFSSRNPGREGVFEFHLGGYSSPFSTVRRVKINVGRVNVGKVQNPSDVHIQLDLAPFFENVDWAKKPAIMSPGSEAARLSEVLAKSFRAHEN